MISCPLDEEFVRKWIEALRSGEYKQGRNQLRTGDSFCCLGVACDISQIGTWGWQGHYRAPDGSYSKLAIPTGVRDSLGDRGNMYSHVPVDLIKEVCPELATEIEEEGVGLAMKSFNEVEVRSVGLHYLNDIYRASFDQIADILEHYLDGPRL